MTKNELIEKLIKDGHISFEDGLILAEATYTRPFSVEPYVVPCPVYPNVNPPWWPQVWYNTCKTWSDASIRPDNSVPPHMQGYTVDYDTMLKNSAGSTYTN